MTRHAKLALILAGLAFVVPQAASAATPNAKLWNGTWHLNAEKSKFVSSAKEQTVTFRVLTCWSVGASRKIAAERR